MDEQQKCKIYRDAFEAIKRIADFHLNGEFTANALEQNMQLIIGYAKSSIDETHCECPICNPQ